MVDGLNGRKCCVHAQSKVALLAIQLHTHVCNYVHLVV